MSGSFFPTIVSIVILIGILYLAHLASKLLGTSTIKKASSKHLKLLDIMSMGQDKAVAAISLGDKHFLIGIAQGGITKLADLTEEDVASLRIDQQETPEVGQGFKDLLAKVKKDR